MRKIVIYLICVITFLSSISFIYANTEVSTNIQKSGDWEYIELDIPGVQRSVVLQIQKNSKGYVAAVMAQKNDNKYYEMLLFSPDLKKWEVTYDSLSKFTYEHPFIYAMYVLNDDFEKYLLTVEDDAFYYKMGNSNNYIKSIQGTNWTIVDSSPNFTYPLTEEWDTIFYLPKNKIYIKGNTNYSGYIDFKVSLDGTNWIEKYRGSAGQAIRSVAETADKIYVFRTQRPWYIENTYPTQFTGANVYCNVSTDKGVTWSNWNEITNKANYFVGKSQNSARGFLCSDAIAINNKKIILVGASDTAKTVTFGVSGNDEKAAIMVYNTPPKITSVTTQSGKYGDNSIIKFNVNVDNISEGTVVHATLNGKKKTIVANNENLSLSWNTNELKKATYEKITFYIEDPDGLQSTYEWKGYIDIDYPLLNLKNLISTYIPDKSNQQRIIIADLDNRKIDTNSQNTYMVENIKDMVEKKNCQLYLIGADNEVTKTLANYFE